jgi:hypothetical protein
MASTTFSGPVGLAIKAAAHPQQPLIPRIKLVGY